MEYTMDKLCPLDGSTVQEAFDSFYACNTCHELLSEGELVTKATHETWAAYLLSNGTDTRVEDAPLSRLT
jgi:hypothetical protein